MDKFQFVLMTVLQSVEYWSARCIPITGNTWEIIYFIGTILWQQCSRKMGRIYWSLIVTSMTSSKLAITHCVNQELSLRENSVYKVRFVCEWWYNNIAPPLRDSKFLVKWCVLYCRGVYCIKLKIHLMHISKIIDIRRLSKS